MSIQVTSREESATRDPFDQNHRHARIGVIVHLAEGAGLMYETFGACGERFKTKAQRTVRRVPSPSSWSKPG